MCANVSKSMGWLRWGPSSDHTVPKSSPGARLNGGNAAFAQRLGPEVAPARLAKNAGAVFKSPDF
jgi:hypothetical protein